MTRSGRPKVTWKSIEEDPDYRAIWELILAGPKTFRQLQEALQAGGSTGQPRAVVLPGTLYKRLKKLERTDLIAYVTDPIKIDAFQKRGSLNMPSPSGRGRPTEGVWTVGSGNASAVRVAIAHADALTETPHAKLTLERIGSGVELLVAGTTGDTARWWYPGSFSGNLGGLFELIDKLAGELAKTILSADPVAVEAQQRLKEAVRLHRAEIDPVKQHVLSVPEVRAAADEAARHQILLSVRVTPAYWWDSDSQLPIDLESTATLTLARVHDRTTPASMPVHAVSREEAQQWEKQGFDMSGGWAPRKTNARLRRPRRSVRLKRKHPSLPS